MLWPRRYLWSGSRRPFPHTSVIEHIGIEQRDYINQGLSIDRLEIQPSPAQKNV